MSTILPWLLAVVIIAFFVRLFMLLRQLWLNYKDLRTKYPVSIWKLPSQNLALMNEEDRKTTKKLYWKYAAHLFFGMLAIIGMTALVVNFG